VFVFAHQVKKYAYGMKQNIFNRFHALIPQHQYQIGYMRCGAVSHSAACDWPQPKQFP